MSEFAETWPPEDGASKPCRACDGSGYNEIESRCVDCFGSGVSGDGQVSVLASRELALLTDCPECVAPAQEPCMGKHGPRKQFHQARHRRAVALLLRGVIDRPDLKARSLGGPAHIAA